MPEHSRSICLLGVRLAANSLCTAFRLMLLTPLASILHVHTSPSPAIYLSTHKFQIMITGISHVNLTVPKGRLEHAAEFYEGTLGFTRVPVPVLQKDSLAWYAYSVSVRDSIPCCQLIPTGSISRLMASKYILRLTYRMTRMLEDIRASK